MTWTTHSGERWNRETILPHENEWSVDSRSPSDTPLLLFSLFFLRHVLQPHFGDPQYPHYCLRRGWGARLHLRAYTSESASPEATQLWWGGVRVPLLCDSEAQGGIRPATNEMLLFYLLFLRCSSAWSWLTSSFIPPCPCFQVITLPRVFCGLVAKCNSFCLIWIVLI